MNTVRRWMLLLGFAGCYAPQPVPGAPCGADSSCPSALVCVADRCVAPGTGSDAAGDAPIEIDAMIDAPIDAPIDSAMPAPRLVQQAGGFDAPATTLTATFSQAPVIGNVLVAVAGCPSASLDSITGGATWQRIASSTVNSNVEVFTGVANGQTSVTIALANCASQMSLSISEWEHVGALDTVTADDGITSPATAGSFSTTGPRLLLFSVANYAPNTFGTPSDGPWSALTPIDAPVAGGVQIYTWYRLAPAGTFAPTVSETHHEWDATLVALTPD